MDSQRGSCLISKLKNKPHSLKDEELYTALLSSLGLQFYSIAWVGCAIVVDRFQEHLAEMRN